MSLLEPLKPVMKLSSVFFPEHISIFLSSYSGRLG